ncbi:hypothetical protein [Streptosporangium sp. KLBMP 9127]|nr:hypothetical protein [Streptosporangium sp. KLBMP 9127]
MVSDAGPARPNIAMWGAPTSGKTTLLAALSIALLQRRSPWRIVGADDASTAFLKDKAAALSRGKEFPRATQAMDRYRWVLIGEGEQRDGLLRRRPKPTPAPRIGLNLLDPPGGVYGDEPDKFGTDQQELLDNLVGSKGIVFLFDPLREFERGDAFDYLYGALTQLAGRMLGSDGYTGDRLPHHLAVCITKFDEYRVLETAKELKLLVTDPEDPYGFPRIDDDDAVELFKWLCRISASGSAEMVLNALDQFFRRDRIKFFVTSSIGFYLDPRTNFFNPDDYQNLIPKPAEGVSFHIRGPVHPINVMEPIVWLGERLAGEPPNEGPGR